MERLWSVKKLAAHTGLSERCLRQLIAEDRLPVVRFAGLRAVRVPDRAVRALMGSAAPESMA